MNKIWRAFLPTYALVGALLLVGVSFLGSAYAQVWPWSSGAATGTGYPAGAAPITISATGTTGAFSATLPASTTRITYICGFTMTSGGTTAATLGNATITGAVSGTLNYTYVYVSSGQGLLGIAFPICIPGSAVNTAIVVNMTAGGAGTTAAITAWGYQL